MSLGKGRKMWELILIIFGYLVPNLTKTLSIIYAGKRLENNEEAWQKENPKISAEWNEKFSPNCTWDCGKVDSENKRFSNRYCLLNLSRWSQVE